MELLTHRDIEQQEIIERYVRDKLSPEERRAFQEHYFTCDDCFAQVEMTERFSAGIRDATERGLLGSDASKESPSPVVGARFRWLQPVVAVTMAVSLLLALTVGWLLFYREPQLREQLARERRLREQVERERQQHLNQTDEQLRLEREARAKLESQLTQQEQERVKLENQIAANNPPRNISPGEVFPNRSESNVPLAMLEATRNAEGVNELTIPAGARNFVLWIEVGTETRFDSYRLQVYANQNILLQTVQGLKKNAYGALAASLPTKSFQAGTYLIKLFGEGGQGTALVGEYRLHISRR